MRLTTLVFALAVPFTWLPATAKPAVKATTVTVRKGDTGLKVARRAGISLARLGELNPGVDLDRLSVRTKLRVSGKVTARAPLGRRKAEPLASLPGLPAEPVQVLARMERLRPLTPEEMGNRFAPGATSPEALAEQLQPVMKPGSSEAALSPLSEPVGFDLADPNNLDLLWPVETRTVSSGFGPRMRSRVKVVAARKSGKNRRIRVPYRGDHRGIDLNAPKGTDVFASMDGRVVFVGRERAMGNYVILDHGNGVETVYGHNTRNFVQVGEVVRRGQKIAEVGRTGRATGPHVHFELRLNGTRINPMPYLNDVEAIPEEILAQNSAAKPPARR